jgi:hypothetical protein
MIPAELTSRPQWVTWRYETRDKKPTKVPYRPSGQRASSTDPKTWTSFEQANAAAKRFDGIGFVFAKDDPYTGVDFDGVIDPDTGEVHPDAAELVQELNSYTELSPSRTGAHVLVKATKNGFPHSSTSKTPWEKKFEVYDQGRFFTFTGKRLNERGIEPRQAELDRVLRRIWPEPAPRQDASPAPKREPAPKHDPAVLERWKEKPRFCELLERPVDDQSERDFALACFAFEHGAEREEVVKLVQASRHSTAGDAKSARGDYLQRTVDAARVRALEKASTEKAGELTELLGLKPDRKVVRVDVYGRGSNATVEIGLANNEEIVLDTIGRVASTTKFTAEIAIQVGARPTLKMTDVVRILALIHDLGEHHHGLENEDRAADFATDYLRAARIEPVRMADQHSRWRAFSLLDQVDPMARAEGSIAASSVVLQDEDTGWLYVRASWFGAHVRQQSGPGEAAIILRAVLRLGWRKPGRHGQIKATAPGRKDTLHWAFLEVPPNWRNR